MPPVFELITFLNRSKTVAQIKQIHAHLLTNGYNHLQLTFLHHLLLSQSTSPTNFQYTHQLFDQLPNPDVFTWACAIRYFAQLGRFKHAISLYLQMHGAGLRPSTFALSGALKSCARLSEKVLGGSIHCQVVKFGYNSDVYVQTSLVGFYSKLGDMESGVRVFVGMPKQNVVSWNSILFGYLKAGELSKARSVFDEIPVKDVISWNSMISGYAKRGDMEQAKALFEKIPVRNSMITGCTKRGDMVQAKALFEEMPVRNSASWNAMISGYADRGEMGEARKLFDEMPDKSNVSWIAMISGYSRCGDVNSAKELFDGMRRKDLLCWNAMISCYAQNSMPKEAIQLFNKMTAPDINVQPDEMTFSCVISACSQLGDLKFGLWIEAYMSRIGIELDDHLATALMDLYAKCGCIGKAYDLFHSVKRKNVVSYSAMILGCGINGEPLKAIRYFEEMVAAQIRPNTVTYTGILTAYNHAGLVDEGYRCFFSMKTEYGLTPTADHYGIMIDLLGRAGQLEEAHRLIKSMPMRPHAGVWGALLLACQLHCNVELGEIAAQHCVELEPDPSGYYSLLANMYAFAERWDDAKRLRKMMEKKKLTKIPGCSWTESI